MDFFDFSNFAVEGTPRLRRITAAIGVIPGAGMGYLFADVQNGSGVLYSLAGAVLGAGLGWLFAAFVVLAVVALAAVCAVLAYVWITAGP
ncbi:hypothetical protein AN189_09360 [Loktanella sp. 3ANDIMAR09]|uniref:hypothetical protein n=1 Tax=Loktanella sp. 3ANDIMAR09 TaxID=1225657 RepID=UPI0006FA8208|nr:hypothetical protein [Loktanella sp. 3ANDIMAR09]KQI68513.1 hypothetical protein AN189_09360 [Loktanella sp. 3ANDIMAR09]